MASESGFPTYDYPTFPRRFVSYRWFKPLLVLLLGFIFMLAFQIVVILVAAIWSGDPAFVLGIGETYEDMDIFSGPGALVEFGGIAVLIPALALAALIVRDRPFSSYSSSRGGWNWGAFFKCLGVAFGVMSIITVAQVLLSLDELELVEVQMTLAGLIVCLLLMPFQCVAEEYVFRGLLLQAIGSWTRLPILGVLGSSLLFALSHPYNIIGVVNIFITGAIWGMLAWKTNGIEASSAMHIVNNLFVLAFAGFGLQSMSSEVDLLSLVVAVLIDVVFAVIVILAGKRFGWFPSKGDGAAAFNEKVLAKRARKQWKREGFQPQMETGALQQPYAAQPYAAQLPYVPPNTYGAPQPYAQKPYASQYQQPNFGRQYMQPGAPQPPAAYRSEYGMPNRAIGQQRVAYQPQQVAQQRAMQPRLSEAQRQTPQASDDQTWQG